MGNPDVFGGALAALGVAYTKGKTGGVFNGVPNLPHVAGCDATFPPHWGQQAAYSTVAGRLYYIPYYFPQIVSYTGLRTYNAATGDSGEVYRTGVYTANPLTGLPDTLVIDAGQTTLTAAAAVRTQAATFSPSYVGWHYLAIHHNSVVSPMGGISATAPGVGGFLFGINTGELGAAATTQLFGCYYATTAYAALAATAVAPSGTLNQAPLVAPYRT